MIDVEQKTGIQRHDAERLFKQLPRREQLREQLGLHSTMDSIAPLMLRFVGWITILTRGRQVDQRSHVDVRNGALLMKDTSLIAFHLSSCP